MLWAGVVAQDPDSATVILATTGTVAEQPDRRQARGRELPLQLDLVSEKGKWLTSDLQFVP